MVHGVQWNRYSHVTHLNDPASTSLPAEQPEARQEPGRGCTSSAAGGGAHPTACPRSASLSFRGQCLVGNCHTDSADGQTYRILTLGRLNYHFYSLKN